MFLRTLKFNLYIILIFCFFINKDAFFVINQHDEVQASVDGSKENVSELHDDSSSRIIEKPKVVIVPSSVPVTEIDPALQGRSKDFEQLSLESDSRITRIPSSSSMVFSPDLPRISSYSPKASNFYTLQQITKNFLANYNEDTTQLSHEKPFKNFTGDCCLPKIEFENVLDDFIEASEHKLWVGGVPHVQKTVLDDKDSYVCFMGDIHGSLHSLLRNFWRLVALNHIDPKNLKAKKENIRFIFLGDYVDRGRYNAEVLYLVLRFKLANWRQVFLVRGNHETEAQNDMSNFKLELRQKYSGSEDQIYNKIKTVYQLLPFAVFTECNDMFFQSCHGGFGLLEDSTYYADRSLISLFKSKNKSFRYIPLNSDDNPIGYLWMDFTSVYNPNLSFEYTEDSDTNRLAANVKATEKFMNFFKSKNVNFLGLFRGHQHFYFGFKLMKDDPFKHPFKPNALISKGTEFDLLHWREMIKDPVDYGFFVNQYDPRLRVFTFSTAVEGVGLPYDCFGILSTKDTHLKIFEFELPSHAKNTQKFISIEKNGESDESEMKSTCGMKDPIKVRFLDSQDSSLAEHIDSLVD